jgi:hypothetical protein
MSLQDVAHHLGVARSGLALKETGQVRAKRTDLLAWSALFCVPLETIEKMIEDEAPHGGTVANGGAGPAPVEPGVEMMHRPRESAYVGPVSTMVVVGDSMSPTLEAGWVINIRRCEWSSVAAGDLVVVTWADSGQSEIYEAFVRQDFSIRLLKVNGRFSGTERQLSPEQAMQLVASVYKVVGRGPS